METPKMPETTKETASKKEKIYLVIVIFLLLGTGFLGWKINEYKKAVNSRDISIANLMQEKDILNNMLNEAGIVDQLDPNDLKANLEEVLSGYENLTNSLSDENTELKDSVEAKKMRINELLAETEKLKSDKKRDWSKIYKLQKETETLRTIMKGYIHTIDSLNTLNIELQNTLVKKEGELKTISQERNEIKTKLTESQETIAKGKILQTSPITAVGLKIKSGGKQVEVNRADRVDMIKACFSIMENKIADPGNKSIFMKVIGPDKKMLPGAIAVSFNNTEGNQTEASVKRDVNYQNTTVDLCIYYETLGELSEGTYTIEIYADGHKIGSTTFALK